LDTTKTERIIGGAFPMNHNSVQIRKEIRMLLKEVMSKELLFCTPSDTAQAAAKIMKAQGVGALPVVSDAEYRRLEGIVTDRDLL